MSDKADKVRDRTDKVRGKVNDLLGVRYVCAADGTERSTIRGLNKHWKDAHRAPQARTPRGRGSR